ncbi:MAG: rod shape-determining protein, partial [Firmicutes bacterium]|nr:rod shape-determining protein [Bacillota bacterium]
MGTDIAIDLGTSNFKVYLDGKGIVLSEPSIIAVDTLTDEVIAIGTEAYKMLG